MVKKLVSGFLILALTTALSGLAAAAVINFDDLGDFAEVPENYQGLTWLPSSSGFAWKAMPNSYYRETFVNTFDFPSNPNAIYPNLNGSTISRATPFNFVSAYIGTSTSNNTLYYLGPAVLTVTGKLAGGNVGTQVLNLSPGPLTLQTFSFPAVDELLFAASGGTGNYWLLDDFTYTNVPLPPGLGLLGSGLLLLWGLGRRKKKI